MQGTDTTQHEAPPDMIQTQQQQSPRTPMLLHLPVPRVPQEP